MRANALANVERFGWAREQQKQVIRAAARWMGIPDRELWFLVTPQSLPRTIHTTRIRYTNRVALCPNCRDKIVPYGNYPWKIDVFGQPWKLTCPSCGEVYPKNDFWAYYLSALDGHGIFQPGKGDRGLLFNAEHPDPRDPLHTFAVDDGYGWTHEEDGRYAFVAYYNSWGQWRALQSGVTALAEAYTLTDDLRYARKVGLLLDRIADVYPAMNLYPYIMDMDFEHSEGGSGFGRVEGCIWETGKATALALAYDRVFDALSEDAPLLAFLDGMAKEFALGDKSTWRAAQKNIEKNLLQEFVKSVKDGRIWGNQGMWQKTMAATAIALDRPPLTEQLLDWVFKPGTRQRRKYSAPASGGNVPQVLMDVLDRDGMGTEGAPGYSLWAHTMLPLAQLVEAYPDYAKHSVFRDFPKYRQCFTTPIQWQCLGQATPPIGDSGTCGVWGGVGAAPSVLEAGFRVYGDPRVAKKLLDSYGRAALHGSIYDDDPEAFAHAVRAAAVRTKELPCVSLNGYGLAIMQTPKAGNGRAMWMYYGRNTGHGHRDRLNLGLYAENLDLMPDLGYPEYASGRPKDLIWTRNSISHNVVIVDDKIQQGGYTGHLLLFDPTGKARVVCAESDGIYKGMTTYRRLSTLVDVSARRGYVADFFWVRGGRVHRQSWHGPPGRVKTTGLKLSKQRTGSFAGEDVPVGQLGDDWHDSPGYMYLHDVRRDKRPPEQFTIDYDATDRRGRISKGSDPHLRLTCLTATSEVALARGDPPQNRVGAPRDITYAVLTRTGDDLESLFVTLAEPYDTKPIIAFARRLDMSVSDDVMAAAVEIRLANGRTDMIVVAEKPTRVEVEGDITFDGTFGIVARRGKRLVFAKLCGGTLLQWRDTKLTCPVPCLRGRVEQISIDDPEDNYAVVKFEGRVNRALLGSIAIFENDRVQDAAYCIHGLRRRGECYKLSTGDKTFIRGYADPKDFSAGLTFHVVPGDGVRIPLVRHVGTP